MKREYASVIKECLSGAENMNARRLILLPFLVFLLLSLPPHSSERTDTFKPFSGRGTPLISVRLRPPLGSETETIARMWLGTWKSSKYQGLTGLVKAATFQVKQEVRAKVELERTILGDLVIPESVIFMGRVFVARGGCGGNSCLIQGWLRKRTGISGFYRISDPVGKHYDWGSFQAEPLEPPKGSENV
ncbi:MAG: hypothetical protein GTN81_13525 [Proteobacteria bacterium]|nr:hypothetical protein [Pseudomonadota bacterium]